MSGTLLAKWPVPASLQSARSESQTSLAQSIRVSYLEVRLDHIKDEVPVRATELLYDRS